MPALASRPAELALRRAMEARDMAAVLEAFAPDAVLHSPLTDRLAFAGREQIGTITQIVLEVSLLTRPLELLARTGDRIGARLVGPTL